MRHKASETAVARHREFGSKLREKRRALGLSLEQLAELVKKRGQTISKQYLSYLENVPIHSGQSASTPTADKLNVLSQALGWDKNEMYEILGLDSPNSGTFNDPKKTFSGVLVATEDRDRLQQWKAEVKAESASEATLQLVPQQVHSEVSSDINIATLLQRVIDVERENYDLKRRILSLEHHNKAHASVLKGQGSESITKRQTPSRPTRPGSRSSAQVAESS